MTDVHAILLPSTLPGGEVWASVGKALDRLRCGVGRGNCYESNYQSLF